MRDFVEAIISLAYRYFGFPVTAEIVEWGIFSLAIVPISSFVVWFYLFLRRSSGDMRAVSGELRAVTQVIATDTRQELNRIIADVSQLHQDLKVSVHERLDALQGMLRSTEQVETLEEDTEVEAEPPGVPPKSNRVRLNLAEQVRETVLKRWVEGRDLKRSSSDPNCYEYYGRNSAGHLFRVLLQTPYRESIGLDDRMPFTLELWVDRRKKLNFEWDSEGRYALRGFRRGDWFEDVANWELQPEIAEKVAA